MAGRFQAARDRVGHHSARTLPPAEAVPSLPVHSLLLVERGVHIIEILNLEEIAQKQVSVFTFFLSPLKIVGATGVPARPLAIRARRKA